MVLNTNYVPPTGPKEAKIVFIGQAPGQEEDRLLEGFVGSAGQFVFNPSLKAAGILRSEVLLWNLFHRRPPKNDVSYFYQDKKCTRPTWEGQEHIDQTRIWLEQLLRQRESAGSGPNVLVALGREAMLALTGKEYITKWRGSVLPCTLVPGFKVYPAYHPAYILRLMNEPEEKVQGQKKQQKLNALPLFLRDLQRIKIQSEFPEIRTPERELRINCSLEEYVHLLRQAGEGEAVSCDIETMRSSKGTIVWCIGFGIRPNLAFTIPLLKNKSFCWSAHEEKIIWTEISNLFLKKDCLKIFQYGNYDLSILGRYYGLRLAPNTYADTMWCFQAAYPYMRSGLATLTSWYTWEPYYKDDGKWWDGRRISDEAEFTYNAKDAAVTREIWPLVSDGCRQIGAWQTYQNHVRSFPSLLRMMIRGVQFDSTKQKVLQTQWTEECSRIEKTVEARLGMEINLNSAPQLQKVFYGFLGMQMQFNKKTGQPSTDKDALNRLRKKYPTEPLIQDVLDYKRLNKLISTYTTMEAEDDSRVRTSYGWITTFRLNSSESHFGGGGNLQNIPVRSEEGIEIRKLFVPDPGKILLAADLVQAEAMEVAWLSNDEELIESFLARVDVHWENAKRIFKLESGLIYQAGETIFLATLDDEVTMKTLRNIAKTVVHAGNYGMGPYKLQSILIQQGMDLEFSLCKQLIEDSAKARPMRVLWQQRTAEEVRIARVLYNCFGDRREFRGRNSANLFNSAYAFRPQSTVGRILQFAIQSIHESVSKFEPLLNVHDEVVGQCAPEDVARLVPQIRACLEIPHIPDANLGRELTIPCDFKVGPSWGEMKELKL